MLTQVDKSFASKVAEGLGIPVPNALEQPLNQSIPADGDPKKFQPVKVKPPLQSSKALSMANTVKNKMKQALETAGAQTKIIAPHLGNIATAKGKQINVDQSLLTAASVLFDAVYVPGGQKSVAALQKEPNAIHFINEAYKHCKAIAAEGEGTELLFITNAGIKNNSKDKSAKNYMANGVLLNRNSKEFIKAIAQHRFWEREN